MDWRAETEKHIRNVQSLLAGFAEHVVMDCSPEAAQAAPPIHEVRSLPEMVAVVSDMLHVVECAKSVLGGAHELDEQVGTILVNTVDAYEAYIAGVETGRPVLPFRTWLLDGIVARAPGHDASKLEEPEAPIFAEYTAKLKGCTYGSDEYKQFLHEMKPALDHHYHHPANRHHPEHFEGGVDDMNLIDVVELACDWFAAGLRHADGNFAKSVEHNTERFKLSPMTAQLLRGTEAFFEMMRPQLEE